MKPPANSLPWAHPAKLPTYNTTVQLSLYSLDFLSTTIDEAHIFRNVGAKHSGALLILEKSIFRFALTATPLQTKTSVGIL